MSGKTIEEALEYASDQIGKGPVAESMAKVMIAEVIKNLNKIGVADTPIEFYPEEDLWAAQLL